MSIVYDIVPFLFDGNTVRVSVRDYRHDDDDCSEADETWWMLVDVCKVLEIGNPSDVARRLDDDEKDVIDSIDAIGRSQTMTIINESGLYSVIFESRKPIAKRFKKWVTSQVLPSIRKTGSYHHHPGSSRDDLLAAIDRLVEPIKGRFIEHDRQLTNHQIRIDDHEGRLIRVENVLPFPNKARGKELPLKDKSLMARAWARCHRYCPCCGYVQIVNADGSLIRDEKGKPIAEYDHHYRVGKVPKEQFWLICCECHRKLTHPNNNPEWPRFKVEARFRAFQEQIAPVYLELSHQHEIDFGA